ncbi:hypothetical protein ABW19_dt0200617 [Dactylella cylindrospora]|nr:hypothetical protein ABW19_dt0200617 [Dactylella cylindrospora]
MFAKGFLVEDAVTIDDMSVDLQFGVATYWNSTPTLGFGLWPGSWGTGDSNYLLALQDQGRITSQYSSFYQVPNPETPGSIVLGGLDRDKFTGKLKIWEGLNYPGVVDPPTARIFNGSVPAGTKVDPTPNTLAALISIDTGSAYVVFNPELNLTAVAVAVPDVTSQDIVELGGDYGAKIEEIIGNQPPPATKTPTPPFSNRPPMAAIVGGTLGGFAFLLALVCGFYLYKRRRQRQMPRLPGAEMRTGYGIQDEFSPKPAPQAVSVYTELPNSEDTIPMQELPASRT